MIGMKNIMLPAPAPRTYARFDLIDSGNGEVAHLSHIHQLDVHGSWYSLCGKIVTGWRASALSDTDHTRVCVSCERKATRRR